MDLGKPPRAAATESGPESFESQRRELLRSVWNAGTTMSAGVLWRGTTGREEWNAKASHLVIRSPRRVHDEKLRRLCQEFRCLGFVGRGAQDLPGG
jgi:hypothetical protein